MGMMRRCGECPSRELISTRPSIAAARPYEPLKSKPHHSGESYVCKTTIALRKKVNALSSARGQPIISPISVARRLNLSISLVSLVLFDRD